ncbi:ABC transporter substrate-binding protein [Streptomyces sp. NBC_00083]|uniref:ABC transporter substrate-binding protein n=1 Tax=Streptomyces sp. NBC_00083 TaxID=2975647 RepID=UPI002255A00D|nr:ABC transporter substrate-binding protein [Streptomyces sp. NBC_00083]MCX5381798.1 ABC transporter substrate-binding protein [Streptomyces sp. NBC_00083]
MTGYGWRRSHGPSRSFGTTATVVAVWSAVGATLLSGCGGLPGVSGGSREPITVMTWAPEGSAATNAPGMPAMAKAFARWVNADGGIDGHELRVLTCNEHNTATGASDCARRAVKEKAAAVVGSYSQYDSAFIPPLEVAGIPYLGGYGISDREFTSALSYPVNGGQAALIAGSGQELAAACDQVSLVRPDTLAGDVLPTLLDAGLTAARHRPAADIRTAEDAGDYTDEAKRALEQAGADPAGSGGGRKGAGQKGGKGCVTAVLGDRTETFFDSFRRVADDPGKVRVASVIGSINQPLLDRTGGADGPFEGAYVTGWYPESDDPRWEPMKRVIREHAFGDDAIDAADSGVQTTWIAYTALKKLVESLHQDSVRALDLVRALNKGVTVDTGGLTPVLRWRFEDMLAAADFPRIVNRQVTFQVVRDGRLVALKKGFTDVSSTMEASAANG